MGQFNLIDEKWIPVKYLNGERKELGIKDTLLRSKDIAVIEDPSPLVVAALHRFLLAILYRTLEGPTDIFQARALFRDSLPGDKITLYLKKWYDRFWLFDGEYPFGQNPNVDKKEIEPWTKLTVEYNATSNKVLFDHTDAKKPGAREPKECARWIVSTMTFSISGGRGYYPSPSPNAIMCIPLGRNLHETLCFNLVPYPNHKVMEGDSALWERSPEKLPLKNPKYTASGYADLYTWPSRMIYLESQPSGEVSFVRFIAGQGFNNPSNDPDPMQPYKIHKIKGKLPVRFRGDRGAWRDFDSLLPDSSDVAPLTIQNALRLADRKTANIPRSMLVLGLRYEPPSANVDFWRMERFILPEALASDRNIRTEINQILTIAQETEDSLRDACRLYARNLLTKGDRSPDKDDIRRFIKQMPVIIAYWSILEHYFHKILQEYTIKREFYDIWLLWLESVRDTLRFAWEQHCNSVSIGDAWAIRALVKAEAPVLRKLKELNDEVKNMNDKRRMHE